MAGLYFLHGSYAGDTADLTSISRAVSNVYSETCSGRGSLSGKGISASQPSPIPLAGRIRQKQPCIMP